MIADVTLGLVVTGARAGRVALAPVRVAARAPLIGTPLRSAGDRLAFEGRLARMRLESLAMPELERAIDRVLAGPLTDAVARSLAHNRVVERVASQVLAELDVERMVATVLVDERTERVVERVLDSAELRRVIGHVAASPEVLEALSRHSETLAEEMVTDVRTRAQRVDDLAERTVRSWLRRPRPSAS